MPNENIGWDADFYNSLTDTIKNVSLTEREIYVLGNLLPMVSWSSRWSGDTSGLDLDAIRGEMEFTIMDEIEVEEMTCEYIADCIESDEAVQDAITESITLDGYTPNPDTNLNEAPPPTLPASSLTKDLLPTEFDCEEQPQVAMGLARAIVSEIHQSVEDFLELIEYATNAAEGLAMASEQIPLFGTAISGALEFVDWVLETWGETYLAAYNQSVEDELSCAIFCHIMDNCTLSIDDLLAIYEDKGSITIPPANDLEAVLTFAIDTPFDPDTICVAMFHYTVLRFMSWGSLGGFSATYLQGLLKNNVSASDYSYEDLCDDCVDPEPTDYWFLHYKLTTGGQQGTTSGVWNGSGNDGSWVGNGYEFNRVTPAVSTANVAILIPDLGASYVIRGIATRSVRRGSDGNGTHDINQNLLYQGANQTGTQIGAFNTGSNTLNTNKVEMGQLNPVATQVARSIVIRSRVNQATNVEPVMLRVYEIVIWGLKGAGDTKPPRAKWAGSTLPATYPELFPDYVAP